MNAQQPKPPKASAATVPDAVLSRYEASLALYRAFKTSLASTSLSLIDAEISQISSNTHPDLLSRLDVLERKHVHTLSVLQSEGPLLRQGIEKLFESRVKSIDCGFREKKRRVRGCLVNRVCWVGSELGVDTETLNQGSLENEEVYGKQETTEEKVRFVHHGDMVHNSNYGDLDEVHTLEESYNSLETHETLIDDNISLEEDDEYSLNSNSRKGKGNYKKRLNSENQGGGPKRQKSENQMDGKGPKRSSDESQRVEDIRGQNMLNIGDSGLGQKRPLDENQGYTLQTHKDKGQRQGQKPLNVNKGYILEPNGHISFHHSSRKQRVFINPKPFFISPPPFGFPSATLSVLSQSEINLDLSILSVYYSLTQGKPLPTLPIYINTQRHPPPLLSTPSSPPEVRYAIDPTKHLTELQSLNRSPSPSPSQISQGSHTSQITLHGNTYTPNSHFLLSDNQMQFRVLLVSVNVEKEVLVVQRKDGSQCRVPFGLLRDGKVGMRQVEV